jgi:hypothetical protein
MEYMFFSLPIVAFDLLETRRSGGDAVCYARVDDEAHFAAEIIALLHDTERRRALGQAARQRLDSSLSWSVSSASLIALMSRLIGAPPAIPHGEAERIAAPGGIDESAGVPLKANFKIGASQPRGRN